MMGGGGGSVNEDELKKFLEENYLKLTDGALTETVKIQSLNPDIDAINDYAGLEILTETGHAIGIFGSNIYTDRDSKKRSTASLMRVCHRTEDKYVDLRVDYPMDGVPYASCPVYPTPDYSDKIVTFKSLQDYSIQKIDRDTNIYVHATNGSDTADLHNGRGFSEDKPFKTLEVAISYVLKSIRVSGNVKIYLLSNVTLSGQMSIRIPQEMNIYIEGKDTQYTIDLNGYYFQVYSGGLIFRNINISGTCEYFLVSNGGFTGASNIYLMSDVSLNGIATSATVRAIYAGQILITGSITGSVTGKRYTCSYGGCIITGNKGANAIPGTIAGTCDSSSTYV